MKQTLLLFSLAFLLSCSNNSKLTLPQDPIRSNQTYHYHEGIAWWDSLSNYSEKISLQTFGQTDASYPLHLAIFSNKNVELGTIKRSGLPVLLINNAIHPGEPDGVDASMAFFRKLASNNDYANKFKDLVIVCIPYYNIGGTLNINSHTRANQNGPKAYGFRGNAQNLDLNRDFVKCDSRNALSFSNLIEIIDPDVYVETHVSNGADYPYVMTYLPTQADKLGYGMDKIQRELLNPKLEENMLKAAFPIVPYVNVHGIPLDSSYTAFYDSPRYSTGLMALRQSFAYITESHMLKPYDDRVQATYKFIESIGEITLIEQKAIKRARHDARQAVSTADSFALDWKIDSTRWRDLDFTVYQAGFKKSLTTGYDRLYYDRSAPSSINMKYYEFMKPTIQRKKPKAYVLNGGYKDVIERLNKLGIHMQIIKADTTIEVVEYRISSFETSPTPFEKHYFHHNTTFSRDTILKIFVTGDCIIELGNYKDRMVVELLEPDGPDSYFNWNFYDAILQQKEWYSPYVFEDEAFALLSEDKDLQESFEMMKASTPGFAQNPQWQLYWIYQQSPHYEASHMQLPIYRIE
ncbi:MAG: hypothetical protein JXR19_11820 [Bacteroidia bacterium]